jgi:hypothetical protein
VGKVLAAPNPEGFPVIKKAWWAAAAACLIPLLSACGGGGSGGGAGAVRLVNASDAYATLDLYQSDTLVSAGVATGTAGAYAGLGAASYTMQLKSAGTTVSTASRTVAADTSYTVIAYTTGQALKSVLLTDSETAPTSGSAKLRVFNASVEAGTLDVYVTAPGAALSSPTIQALAGEHIGGYTEITAGSYEIRVTGTGDKTDLRLDIPSVTLTDQQIATLVVTGTPGGVLVHGLVVNQKDTVTPRRNTSARVRLVASAASNASVAATVNGTPLSAGTLSPFIGNYTLVPAGTLAMSASINGTALATPAGTLVAGSDTTLLVTGTVAAPALTLLNDDNSPALTTANTKIRLVNGVSGLAAPLSLLVDFAPIATDLALAAASTPVSTPATTDSVLQVTTATATLFDNTATPVALTAGHVYTMFMVGDSTTPVGRLRRDR